MEWNSNSILEKVKRVKLGWRQVADESAKCVNNGPEMKMWMTSEREKGKR